MLKGGDPGGSAASFAVDRFYRILGTEDRLWVVEGGIKIQNLPPNARSRILAIDRNVIRAS